MFTRRACGLAVRSVLLLLLALSARCTGEKEAAVANLELAIPRGACWIFHHMRRSGGEPIKAILNSFIARHSIKRGLYGNSSWRKGTDFARDFCNHDYVVSWGAYTESLRPRKGTNSCKWFTVFRHPVSRVVSAYFHCRKEGTPWKEHSLCSASATDPEFRVDLLNFARHWGNFGLRQFALAFVLPEEITESSVAKRCPECPEWYLLKLYLEGGQTATEQDLGITEGTEPMVVLDELLAPAQELLSSSYAAVGILENFNETLNLFTHVLDMPGLDWLAEYGAMQVGTGAESDRKRSREGTMDSPWEDAELKEVLALDMLLYEQAVEVHISQLDRYLG